MPQGASNKPSTIGSHLGAPPAQAPAAVSAGAAAAAAPAADPTAKGQPVDLNPMSPEEIAALAQDSDSDGLTPEQQEQWKKDQEAISEAGKDPLTRYLDTLPPEQRDAFGKAVLNVTNSVGLGLVADGPPGALAGAVEGISSEVMRSQLVDQLVSHGISEAQATEMADHASSVLDLLNTASTAKSFLDGSKEVLKQIGLEKVEEGSSSKEEANQE